MSFDSTTITAEKNLWTIWTTARRIRRNRFNRWCIVATMAALFLYLCLSKQSPESISDMVRSWANVGIGFAGTILGFLVAGFTIFATLSKPSLLVAMAEHVEDQSKLSYLKYNFFVFFETFGWYVGFTALCVLILIFGAVNGGSHSIGNFAARLVSRCCGVVFAASGRIRNWNVVRSALLRTEVVYFQHLSRRYDFIRWAVEYPENENRRVATTLLKWAKIRKRHLSPLRNLQQQQNL